MKAALLAALGLMAACMGSDQSLEPRTMTLAPPPGPIALVRRSEGIGTGRKRPLSPKPPYPLEQWRLGA